MRFLGWRRRKTERTDVEPAGHPDRPKVFCIGFHKTGTTSLEAALTTLGYRVAGPFGIKDKTIACTVEEQARRIVPAFDAFQDNPWPIIYRFLDREYPGSRFILSVRPADRWIASVIDHFAENRTPMREWIYGPGVGSPLGNEAIYVERYERHNREVREYFRDRSGDLLVFDMFAGDGWDELCSFLGHPVPGVLFPQRNSKAMREKLDGRRKRRSKAPRGRNGDPP